MKKTEHGSVTASKLEEILFEQQKSTQEEVDNPEIISRSIFSQYLENLESKFITVIIGHRGCGKTTLALQGLKNKNYLYFNFDDEFLSQISAKNLNQALEAGLAIQPKAKYLLFDEIQNIEGWEFFINRLQRQKYHIVITGSNSRLLSSELSSHLTGRHLSLDLFPFSFAEYLIYKKQVLKVRSVMTTAERALLQNLFMENMEAWGFPEILDSSLTPRLTNDYIRELYDKIISRDIVQRRNIKNIKALKEIVLLLLSNYASRFTFQSIKRASSINSINTVKNYIDYLQESYIGFIVEPFSYKVKERISLPKKFYAIDLSYINIILNKQGSDLGKKLENIVYLELRRRHNEVYYLYDSTYEVDFAIREGRNIMELIQVAWDLEDEKTRERELKSLVKASGIYNVKNLTLITYKEESEIIRDGLKIQVHPIWKWL